jgi:hydantoinase/carbamoylase family amidase
MNLPVAEESRVRRDIESFASCNASPGNGVTRFTYSEEDRRAREYFFRRAGELGLETRIDPFGNIFARMRGADPALAPVLTGSHLDTVLHGGRYDGAAGVAAALESFRILSASGIVPKRPLEIVVFVEEEGPYFGSPLSGSRALTGVYGLEKLKALKNPEGVSMYEAARAFGLEPDALPSCVLRQGDARAMIEVHVEQSVVLERDGFRLGIVSGIAGMRWLNIRLTGKANHAGATPMGYRQDALLAAARVIVEVEKAARTEGAPSAVATVGRLDCRPNTPNVIPGEVEFTVDIRDTRTEGIEGINARILELLGELEKENGITFSIRTAGSIAPTVCSPLVAAALAGAARDLGVPAKSMPSGALHDAAVMAGITDIGMLFLPSKGGRSHVPEEETAISDIALGAEVLARALLELGDS